MTIRKGEEWGAPAGRPRDVVTVDNDRELAEIAVARPSTPVTLAGGDLHRSVGAPPPRDDMYRLPIDLLRVTVDGAPHVAAAHVVIRRGWWRGEVIAAMNADHVGEWYVAPRAHPNDGRVDVVTIASSMSWRDRLKVRQRLPQGTHLPHPQIAARSVAHMSWEFDSARRVWIDHAPVGTATRVSIEVEPDAFAIFV